MRHFLDELRDFFKKGDITLLILALIVAGFGCVCMASATSAEKFGDSNLKYIVVQILAIALGGTTARLKFGHRGANQPAKDMATGKVEITAPNHSFAVQADSLPAGVEVTHINLNDDSVAGIICREKLAAGMEYTPEAKNGCTFGTFTGMINSAK